jgi:hypothetical protein
MIRIGLALAAALTTGVEAPEHQCSDELFRISRNKNANVIVYELSRSPDGTIDVIDPIHASWIMLARKGEREDLNFLERTLAYGFEVRSAAPQEGWWLTLKAEKKRPLRVVQIEGCHVALVAIGGHDGVLKRIYVKAKDGGLIPSVEYVDVFGIEPSSGAALHEHIVPARALQSRGHPW